MNQNIIKCGLGLRREHLDDIISLDYRPGFWEIVPENWLYMPFSQREAFEKIVSQNFIVAHGVSLSIASDTKPSKSYLKMLKNFLDRYEIKHFSDHISFSHLDAHNTHELLPFPLTKQSLELLCQRVDYVQNFLKRELILENATYYYTPNSDMSESEFINSLTKQSGVKLLLDVNNVYVNSINHNFDAYKFIDSLDLNPLSYIHIAGHMHDRHSGFVIDTHGQEVCDGVWKLLAHTLKLKKVPCMIERDSDIPKLKELIDEYERLVSLWSSI